MLLNTEATSQSWDSQVTSSDKSVWGNPLLFFYLAEFPHKIKILPPSKSMVNELISAVAPFLTDLSLLPLDLPVVADTVSQDALWDALEQENELINSREYRVVDRQMTQNEALVKKIAEALWQSVSEGTLYIDKIDNYEDVDRAMRFVFSDILEDMDTHRARKRFLDTVFKRMGNQRSRVWREFLEMFSKYLS